MSDKQRITALGEEALRVLKEVQSHKGCKPLPDCIKITVSVSDGANDVTLLSTSCQETLRLK